MNDSRINIDDLKRRLNENPIKEFTKEEWQYIYDNQDLRKLFISKVRRQVPFIIDDRAMPMELQTLLLNKQNLVFTLENLRKNDKEAYVKFCNSIWAILHVPDYATEIDKTAGKGTSTVMKFYYEMRKNDIFKIATEIDITEQEEIEDPEIINYIIKHNCFNALKLIPRTNHPSKELEDYIIKSINNITYSINISSERIISEAVQNHKAYILPWRVLRNNPELEKSIVDDYISGLVEFKHISNTIMFENRENLEFVKAIIENNDYYSANKKSEDFITYHIDNPEIEKLIIKKIKEKIIDGKDFTKYMYKSVELFEAVLTSDVKLDDTFMGVLYLTELLNKDPEAIQNILIKFYENNISKREHIVTIISALDINNQDKLNELSKRILPTLTFEEIIKICNGSVEISSNSSNASEYFDKHKQDLSYEITTIPSDYNFDVDYGDDILLKVIPKLNIYQLDIISYTLYTRTIELFEALVSRAAELESNKLNSTIIPILKENPRYRTETVMNIVMSKENPLTLGISDIAKVIELDELSLTQIRDYIDSSSLIEPYLFERILYYIIEDNITQDKLELLEHLLKSSAIDKISTRYQIIIKTLDKLNKKENISENEKSVFYNKVKEYVMSRDIVFLSTTIYFDEDVRRKVTYNDKFLENDIYTALYYKTLPDDYYEFIKESIQNNKKISFIHILFYAYKINDKNVLNYENIQFNDLDKYSDLNRIVFEIDEDLENEVSIKLIELLIKNYSIEKIINIKALHTLISAKEEMIPLLLKKIIETDKIIPDDIYSMDPLFFNDELMKAILQKNPKFIEKYMKYIQNQIRTNHALMPLNIDNFIPSIEEIYEIPGENIRELSNLYGFSNVITLFMEEDHNIIELLKMDTKTVKRFVNIFKTRKLDIETIKYLNDSLQQQLFMKNHPEEKNIFSNILLMIENGITDEQLNQIVERLCKKENDSYLYMPKELDFGDIYISTYYKIFVNSTQNRSEEDKIRIIINIKKLHKGIISLDSILEEKELYQKALEEILSALALQEKLNELYKSNKEEFIKFIIKEAKSSNASMYLELLHQITEQYIHEKRNEVTKKEDVYEDTNLTFEYDEKSKEDAFFKYLYKERLDDTLHYILNTEKFNELDRKTLLLLGNRINVDEKEAIEIKKNIPRLKKKLKRTFETMKVYQIPEEYKKDIKIKPVIPERKNDIELNKKINFNEIYKIIADDEKYAALIRILDKLKILDWDKLFNNSLNSLTIEGEEIDFFCFINSFSMIYEDEKYNLENERDERIRREVEKRRINEEPEETIKNYISEEMKKPLLPSISAYEVLKYCTMFSSLPNCYKIIIGLEDANWIIKNPSPNSSDASVESRLESGTNLLLNMMENEEITVPSFVKNHEFESGRRPLQVIVGCRADSRNLTHGERTGACMRAFGVCNELWNLAGNDPRGFHITFVDPVTGEYISRASGFRNGNTIFLNQLRHTCNQSSYLDSDIIEACKDIAREIIERSKDSEYPIENVVCSDTEALYGHEVQELSESTSNFKEGILTQEAYLNVSEYSVVLATTGEDNKPVPVKLTPEVDKQPKYQCCRLPARRYGKGQVDSTVKILIQRINAIKECVNHKEETDFYKSIDYDFDILYEEYDYVIIGQDYYVALKTNGTIVSNYIFEKEETIKEYNEAYSEVEQYKNSIINKGGSNYGI